MTAGKLGRKGRRGGGQLQGAGQHLLEWLLRHGGRKGLWQPSPLFSWPLTLWFLMEGWFHPGCYGPTFLDAVDTGTQPYPAPASWETHPLIWSDILATDHHPGQCQEAVAQIADLREREREHKDAHLSLGRFLFSAHSNISHESIFKEGLHEQNLASVSQSCDCPSRLYPHSLSLTTDPQMPATQKAIPPQASLWNS